MEPIGGVWGLGFRGFPFDESFDCHGTYVVLYVIIGKISFKQGSREVLGLLTATGRPLNHQIDLHASKLNPKHS